MGLSAAAETYGRDLKEDLALAVRLGEEAQNLTHSGAVASRWKTGTRHYTLPEEVTEDDIAINRHVVETLSRERAGDNILTEEGGFQPGADYGTAEAGKGWTWVCDPIDGTYSYRMGLDMSCFSLALCHNGEPQLAVATTYGAAPEIWWAIRRQGAWVKPVGADLDDSRRLQVNPNPHPGDGVDISCGEHNGALTWHLTTAGIRATRCQSSVRGALLTVAGRNAGWVVSGTKPWDIAAVVLLTEEAGGEIITYRGDPLGNLLQRDTLRIIGAANRNVAETIRAALHLAYNTGWQLKA